MKIKIHTYPDGPAVGLPKDEIVSAMGLRGKVGQKHCATSQSGVASTAPRC